MNMNGSKPFKFCMAAGLAVVVAVACGPKKKKATGVKAPTAEKIETALKKLYPHYDMNDEGNRELASRFSGARLRVRPVKAKADERLVVGAEVNLDVLMDGTPGLISAKGMVFNPAMEPNPLQLRDVCGQAIEQSNYTVVGRCVGSTSCDRIAFIFKEMGPENPMDPMFDRQFAIVFEKQKISVDGSVRSDARREGRENEVAPKSGSPGRIDVDGELESDESREYRILGVANKEGRITSDGRVAGRVMTKAERKDFLNKKRALEESVYELQQQCPRTSGDGRPLDPQSVPPYDNDSMAAAEAAALAAAKKLKEVDTINKDATMSTAAGTDASTDARTDARTDGRTTEGAADGTAAEAAAGTDAQATEGAGTGATSGATDGATNGNGSLQRPSSVGTPKTTSA